MSKEGKNKRLTYIAGAVVLAVIVALIFMIVMLLNREPVVIYEPVIQLIEGPGRDGYVRNPGGRGFVVTEENVAEVMAEMERRRIDPRDRHFMFNQSFDWRFPASLQPSTNAVVTNDESNSRTIFFDVYIEEFGVVYVSPFMPLGSTHRNFALDEDLPPGRYSSVVTYFLVDDDLEIITDVSVSVTIIIES